MINLPNFFIIGAAKSGTTTLYDSLCGHPQIFMTEIKEPSFFNNEANFSRGLDWYSTSFFQNSSRFPLRGEATPGYLFWSDKVAPRIHAAIGNQSPRFIVIFRDPVARAYSAYWHLKHYGGEPLDFADALAVEPLRLHTIGDELKASGFIKYAYFQGGCYASQLESFLRYFPKENFLFLLHDDLKSDFFQVIKSMYAFLGIEPSLNITRPLTSNVSKKMRNMDFYRFLRGSSKLKNWLKPLLPAKLRRNIKSSLIEINMTRTAYPPIDQIVAQDLRIRYQSEISKLENIIGRDLSNWKTP